MTLWLPSDETLSPTLDGRVLVEPKDRLTASEDERQAAFVATMRRVARGCEVAAFANGGKRSQWAAAKVKREGLATGWVDLCVVWTGAVAWIEFKDARSMPRANQIERLNWLVARDHPVMVARTAAAAMGWLASLGAPVPIGVRTFGEVAADVVARIERGEALA